jgi:hypothetical protein
MSRTRAELVEELMRLEHVWDGHPIHSDMSETMMQAIMEINYLDALERALHNGNPIWLIKPSPLLNGRPRHVPGDK